MNFIKEAKRLQKLAGILIKEDEQASLNIPNTNQQEPPEQEVDRVINKQDAKQLIKDTKGRFFTVTFIKKDGTKRIMNARLGVKAYLRGGELPYDPEEKGLIPVYYVKTGDYRMVNINTIIHLKIGNNEYEVN